MASNDECVITLSKDEAFVLFEWLARTKVAERPEMIADQAEQRVLWDLEAAIESRVPHVLSHSYASKLAEARARVRDVAP